MTSVARLSRNVLIGFSRSSATTTTPSGGARVQPSGASKNLSEASRAGDGTDMAMRDAAQQGTNPKSTGQQSNAPKGEASSPVGKIALAIGLAAGAYYAYKYYASKSLAYNTDVNRRDSRAQSADRDVSTGKKH